MLIKKVDPRAYVGALLAAIDVIGLIMFNDLWPLWLMLLAVGMLLLMSSMLSRYEYQCQKCQGVYKLGVISSLASRHGRDRSGNWAISRCPHCGTITKAKESRSHGQEKV